MAPRLKKRSDGRYAVTVSYEDAEGVKRRHTSYTGDTYTYRLTGYEDAASVAEWGRHHKSFTIHGNGANAAALAASIFARSAAPAIRPESVTLPVKTTAQLTDARAFLDLYSLVRVNNADKGVNNRARITSIRHRITPDGWLLDLGFAPTGAVASPQLLPPVQDTEPAGPPYLLAAYTPPSAAVGATWVDLSSWTVVEHSGITNAAAAFTIGRPGRYRLKLTTIYDASGTAGTARGARWVVNSTPTPYATGPGFGTTA